MTLLALPATEILRGNKPILTLPGLTIASGERVALLGPSGAGKSTLLDALYRLRPREIAWCPQQLGLVEPLSLFHNVYIGALARHSLPYHLVNLARPWPNRYREIQELMTPLGLADRLESRVVHLSGGQRQRTALGRALYRQQPTFLGDEPITGIDPVQGPDILRRVLEAHTTSVVALHDAELARTCCHRLIGLKAGRMLFDKAAGDVTDGDLNRLYR
ncbi:ATP-binding cassette domain-containing protein [Ferrimonas gelatinilytica]|uniref:ATP-binding cassette domain-containing protein n=1 Tax=Ferrimonas gelatinilytica TaxID=1255257 RepID=A0ABP9S6G3_9GAMM